MLLTGNVVRKSLKSRRLVGYLWWLSSHCINSSVLQFMLHVILPDRKERWSPFWCQRLIMCIKRLCNFMLVRFWPQKNVNQPSASWVIDSEPIRAQGIIVKYPMQNKNNAMRYKANLIRFWTEMLRFRTKKGKFVNKSYYWELVIPQR